MVDDIILSIKPCYCRMIFSGMKRFEYRKRGFSRVINRAFLYETAPTQKVVGKVEVVRVLEGTPLEIWNLTRNFAGIGFEEYIAYYKNQSLAYALELVRPVRYVEPKNLLEYGLARPPQSFSYCTKEMESVADSLL